MSCRPCRTPFPDPTLHRIKTMTLLRPFLNPLALVVALFMPLAASAADDHGHDHGASAAPAGPALPRFAAVSEAFELVGVLSGKQLLLYLDRAPDNSPVTEARIELDVAGTRLVAKKHGADEFEVMLATEPKPGVLPITATVTVGSETDLLAGELDLHADAHAAVPHGHSWREYAPWVAGAVAALAVLAVLARRFAGRRPLRAGGAA